MKIATFNANSIRARMPLITKWLSENRPDVLCVQETKVADEVFPLLEITGLGYRAVFKGEKSYNGVALLSLDEMKSVWYGFDGEGRDEGTRLIAASVGGVSIVNTYVPQGTSPDSERFRYKLGWFARLRAFFEEHYRSDDLLVWTGDFNVAPEPIDVHNPKALLGHVGFHPEEHRALAKVRDWGFTDVFRLHTREGGHYSFWDYRAKDAVKKGLGWRVDHVWATERMAEKSLCCRIDTGPRLWEKPSDHTPVIAEFKV